MSKVSVLIPGAGLGRLAWEIARLGYICQGNDWEGAEPERLMPTQTDRKERLLRHAGWRGEERGEERKGKGEERRGERRRGIMSKRDRMITGQ